MKKPRMIFFAHKLCLGFYFAFLLASFIERVLTLNLNKTDPAELPGLF